MLRNIITVVRCPAIGGVAVQTSACNGSGKYKTCPHYKGSKNSVLECVYPKTFSNKGSVGEERREQAMIRSNQTPSNPLGFIQTDQIFSLHIHEHNNDEWRSARINIT